MRATRLFTALIAVVLLAAAAPAPPRFDTAAWGLPTPQRPCPDMLFLHQIQGGTCQPAAWRAYLNDYGLEELTAPEGGRAYRWMWRSFDYNNQFGIGAPVLGFVQVRISAEGWAEISSTWKLGWTRLSPKEFAAFETALAASAFATMPSEMDDGATCLDDCNEQVLEAVIDGRYHYIHRVPAVPDDLWRIASPLETIAQRHSHR